MILQIFTTSANLEEICGKEILPHVIEVFARGFCFTRSFTHPYLAERIGKIWVVRDAPRKRGDYRREEWIVHGVAPEVIDETGP